MLNCVLNKISTNGPKVVSLNLLGDTRTGTVVDIKKDKQCAKNKKGIKPLTSYYLNKRSVLKNI